MSLECGECERDLRGGHAVDCSRYKPDSEHELDNDLPAYLVFLILGHIKNLRTLQPDHVLVKAVEGVLNKLPPDDPEQIGFPF